MVALLDDRDAIEGGIELTVASAVQAIMPSCLSRATRNGRRATEARKRSGVAKAAHVAGLGDDRGGEVRAGSVKIPERIAVLGEQLCDLPVELDDAGVEILDVASELADAAGCRARGKAFAQLQALELLELALAVTADDAALCDRVVLNPVGAQPLDRLRAVANEAPTLQLKRSECPHELRLLGGTQLPALCAHDVSDRKGIPRICLAGSASMTLTVGAPSRDLQNLKASAGERGDQTPPITAWALNADHRARSIEVDKPVN